MSSNPFYRPKPEIEIAGETYRISKMPTTLQFHVMRRIGPLVSGVAAMLINADTDEDGLPILPDSQTMMAELLPPVAQGLSEMSDKDADYIMAACLSVVERKQPGDKWVPLQASNGKTLRFQDMELPSLLKLAFEVIKDNLGAFSFGEVLGKSKEPPQTTTGSPS
jgi:hypothetical protein